MSRVIIARTARDAHEYAKMDYGWKRTGLCAYKDTEGENVRVVVGINQLRGTRPDRIYLGHDYFLNKEMLEVEYFLQTRPEIEVYTHTKTMQLSNACN